MRYAYQSVRVALIGLAAAALLSLGVTSAHATLICPPNAPNASYCLNLPPVAQTSKTMDITGTLATLRGISGPGVAGGDITDYFFEWGTTGYGHRTQLSTADFCPAGASRCAGVHASSSVSVKIRGLQPCTSYRTRIISNNSGGTANGDKSNFTTRFTTPIGIVKAPGRVKTGQGFVVKSTIRYRATVRIELRQKGRVVTTYRMGSHAGGSFSKRITAPKKVGKYVLRVAGDLKCGEGTVDQALTVK